MDQFQPPTLVQLRKNLATAEREVRRQQEEMEELRTQLAEQSL